MSMPPRAIMLKGPFVNSKTYFVTLPPTLDALIEEAKKHFPMPSTDRKPVITLGTDERAILLQESMPFVRDRELLVFRWDITTPKRQPGGRVRWDEPTSVEYRSADPSLSINRNRFGEGAAARQAHMRRVLQEQRDNLLLSPPRKNNVAPTPLDTPPSSGGRQEPLKLAEEEQTSSPIQSPTRDLTAARAQKATPIPMDEIRPAPELGVVSSESAKVPCTLGLAAERETSNGTEASPSSSEAESRAQVQQPIDEAPPTPPCSSPDSTRAPAKDAEASNSSATKTVTDTPVAHSTDADTDKVYRALGKALKSIIMHPTNTFFKMPRADFRRHFTRPIGKSRFRPYLLSNVAADLVHYVDLFTIRASLDAREYGRSVEVVDEFENELTTFFSAVRKVYGPRSVQARSMDQLETFAFSSIETLRKAVGHSKPAQARRALYPVFQHHADPKLRAAAPRARFNESDGFAAFERALRGANNQSNKPKSAPVALATPVVRVEEAVPAPRPASPVAVSEPEPEVEAEAEAGAEAEAEAAAPGPEEAAPAEPMVPATMQVHIPAQPAEDTQHTPAPKSGRSRASKRKRSSEATAPARSPSSRRATPTEVEALAIDSASESGRGPPEEEEEEEVRLMFEPTSKRGKKASKPKGKNTATAEPLRRGSRRSTRGQRACQIA